MLLDLEKKIHIFYGVDRRYHFWTKIHRDCCSYLLQLIEQSQTTEELAQVIFFYTKDLIFLSLFPGGVPVHVGESALSQWHLRNATSFLGKARNSPGMPPVSRIRERTAQECHQLPW
jgi:hypothetical protein